VKLINYRVFKLLRKKMGKNRSQKATILVKKRVYEDFPEKKVYF